MDNTVESMQWVSALSTQASLEAAVQDVAAQLSDQLTAPPQFGMVFISSAFMSEYARLLPLLHQALSVPCLIGCGSGGVVGTATHHTIQEVEQRPALSVVLATLPGVEVNAFHLKAEDLPDLDSPPSAWIDTIGISPDPDPYFILLADPFTANITELLQGLDFAYPDAVKVGGLASGNMVQRSGSLFLNDTLHSEGVVGVALSGNIVLDAIVAQGCRPIGQPFRIAAAERNILLALEDPDDLKGKRETPLTVLQQILSELSEEEQALVQNSLFVGIAQDSFQENLHHGDFLIRNLLGVDPKIGAIAVGDRLRIGQRIQFHLRDARTSAEDLKTLLSRYRAKIDLETTYPIGALMFACLGRGEGLYQEANFDSGLFQHHLNGVPLSGFFCGGEIGPVGETTFLHGYTSVFAICRPAH